MKGKWIEMKGKWMEMKGNESNEQPSGLLIRSSVPQTLLTLWGGLLIRCWHYIYIYTSIFQVPTNHFLIVWSVRYAQWRTLSNPNRSSSQNMHTWLTYPSKSSDQDFRPISHWLATQRKIMENPRELHFSTREWHALTSMKNRATRTKSPPKSTYLA